MATYTEDHVEAALCAWEWMLEHQKELGEVWDNNGTSTLRMHCIELGPYIDQVYNLMPEDARSGLPFDWEIVPRIMGHIDWATDGRPRFPSAILMARVVSLELKEA